MASGECPILSAYRDALSDALPDVLSPAPAIAGTAAGPECERRRAYLLTDRAVRVIAPLALRAAGLSEEAARLESLPPVTDPESAARAAAAADGAYEAARAVVGALVAAALASGAAGSEYRAEMRLRESRLSQAVADAARAAWAWAPEAAATAATAEPWSWRAEAAMVFGDSPAYSAAAAAAVVAGAEAWDVGVAALRDAIAIREESR